jgi:hypothetical protein
MAIYQSEKLKSSQHQAKLESLGIQCDFLATVQSRHRIWATYTANPQAAEIHAEIATLIDKLSSEYERLLAVYNHNGV